MTKSDGGGGAKKCPKVMRGGGRNFNYAQPQTIQFITIKRLEIIARLHIVPEGWLGT